MFSLFTTTPPAFRDDIILPGERILLRPLSADDADEMFLYASDPQVTEFLPWLPAPDASAVRPFLVEQVSRRKRSESMGFAIIARDTGAMIGSTDLMDLRIKRGQGELGYLIAREFWGQGLMTEAAHLTVAYGFDRLNLSCVIAFADAENGASRRVLEKLGMERTVAETRIVKMESRPYVRYELTRAVWNARREKNPATRK